MGHWFEWGTQLPSFEYPKGSQIDYVYGAALWVGGIVDGDTLVSVGADGWFRINEMFPDAYPRGQILQRVPDDPFAISDQDRLAVYTDTLTYNGLINRYPDEVDPIDSVHRPLNIKITQASYAWSDMTRGNFIILDYVIENIGSSNINDAWIGFYLDSDIWYLGDIAEEGFRDDLTGFLPNENIAYVLDNDGDPRDGAWNDHSPRAALGVKLLYSAPAIDRTNFNWWFSENNPGYDWGARLKGTPADPFRDFGTGGLGTPAGDANKYYTLSHNEQDYDQLWAAVDMSPSGWLLPGTYINVARNIADGTDTKFLYSFGPYDIPSGSSIRVIAGFVIGDLVHTSPNDFKDCFDRDNPQLFYDRLDFGNLVANMAAAETLALAIKDIPTDCRDYDIDNICDDVDNCLNLTNIDQSDIDGDGVGNACDNCPSDSNPYQEDIDGDGIGDVCEVLRSWYVQHDGTGDAPNIQAAIDSCTHGDSVLVAPGIYGGEGNYNINPHGKQILIKSKDGPQLTILDYQTGPYYHERAFLLENNEDHCCAIDGFTIAGEYAPPSDHYGGGIFIDGASPVIRNCIFIGNAAGGGGAVYLRQADIRFVNCTFADNTANSGSAIRCGYNANSILENCVIVFNKQSEPITCDEGGSATLSCCDVYDNEVGDWVGCLAGQQYGAGNFSRNPLFCDPDNGDYTLDTLSPCASENNYCHELIGACDVGCSNWAVVCDARVERGMQLIGITGIAKNSVPLPGDGIEFIPDHLLLNLTFCKPVAVTFGDEAKVCIDDNHDFIFGEDELYPAAVSRIDGNPTREITIRVSLNDNPNEGDAALAVYAVGSLRLIDESGNLIDYLNLNPNVTGIGSQGSLAAGDKVISRYSLGNSHPNPFNSTTTIPYALPEAGQVRLEIYDILGRRVKILINENCESGCHEASWDGTNDRSARVPSGIYFYRMTTTDFAQTKKMVLMK
jgi:hypothetical protein